MPPPHSLPCPLPSPVALPPPSRREAYEGDEEVPWDEEEVYRFMLAFYSGEQAQPDSPAAGLRSRRSSWADAGFVVLLVAGGVYMALHRSAQYRMHKSSSRSL